MKIEDHRKLATYKDIEVGECFEYDGDIWMKVMRCVDGSNAVDIGCGLLAAIKHDESVWMVDAKVVIEG